MVFVDLEPVGGVPQISVAGSPEQSVDQSRGSGRRQAGRTRKQVVGNSRTKTGQACQNQGNKSC